MSNFQWKKFEDTRQRFEERITITKSGGLGFPKKFCQDHEIKKYKYVVLYFDSSQLAVGIQFSNDESEKGRIKIAHSQEYGASVNAQTFFRANKVEYPLYKGKYLPTADQFDDKDLFVIKLMHSVSDKQEDKNGFDSGVSQEAGA